MKFSTRTTYGLRAMIRLAENYGKKHISLSSIAKEEGISLGYLERLFAKLKKSGLIKSEIGVKGGYFLSKSPKDINIYEVIEVLEGKISPFHCVDESGKIFCSKDCKCGATQVLVKVQSAVNKTLKSMYLNDLI